MEVERGTEVTGVGTVPTVTGCTSGRAQPLITTHRSVCLSVSLESVFQSIVKTESRLAMNYERHNCMAQLLI